MIPGSIQRTATKAGPSGRNRMSQDHVSTHDAEQDARNDDIRIYVDGQIVARDQAVVSVSDTGPGISPENMARVFEPYFTTKKSGTGLGLLIVRRVVREHGGEIELTSKPGDGTRMVVRLPGAKRPPRFLPERSGEEEASVEETPASARGNGAERVIEV